MENFGKLTEQFSQFQFRNTLHFFKTVFFSPLLIKMGIDQELETLILIINNSY